MQEITYFQGRRIVKQAPKPFVSRGARILEAAQQGIRAIGTAPNGMRITIKG